MQIERDRRLGRFLITTELVERGAARLVMAACTVVRCEHLWASDAFEYVAISPHFRPLPLGEQIPEYVWIVTSEEPLGFVSVRAEPAPKYGTSFRIGGLLDRLNSDLVAGMGKPLT